MNEGETSRPAQPQQQRQACDRCHGQKLRCHRGVKPSGACQRCARAGEKCTYSPPLRLGRPAGNAKRNVNHRRSASLLTDSENSVSEVASKQDSTGTTSEMSTYKSKSVNPSCGAMNGFLETRLTPSCEGQARSTRTGTQQKPITTTPQSCPADQDITAGKTPVSPNDVLATPLSMLHVINDGSYVSPGLEYQLSNAGAPPSATNIHHHESVGMDFDTNSINNMFMYEMCDVQTQEAPLNFMAPESSVAPSMPSNGAGSIARELSLLQLSLYDTCSGITSGGLMDGADGFKRAVNQTTQAAHTLLDMISSLILTAPTSQSDSTDVSAIFLVGACYVHILRNSDCIAARLREIISSGDEHSLRVLPSFSFGGNGLPSSWSGGSAIQTALLIQLLHQTLREIEKKLRVLSDRACRNIGADTPEFNKNGEGDVGRRGIDCDRCCLTGARVTSNKSHVADIFTAIEHDVAGLEASVGRSLSGMLDLLSA